MNMLLQTVHRLTLLNTCENQCPTPPPVTSSLPCAEMALPLPNPFSPPILFIILALSTAQQPVNTNTFMSICTTKAEIRPQSVEARFPWVRLTQRHETETTSNDSVLTAVIIFSAYSSALCNGDKDDWGLITLTKDQNRPLRCGLSLIVLILFSNVVCESNSKTLTNFLKNDFDFRILNFEEG